MLFQGQFLSTLEHLMHDFWCPQTVVLQAFTMPQRQVSRRTLKLLLHFEFSRLVCGVGSGPIGFLVALIFKLLDAQPVKSNMDPVPIDVHDSLHF